MSATLFTSGVVWTGTGTESDALLVVDGVVRALGDAARQQAAEFDCQIVDLEGGFLMPSFGDGHAHPLYGGLEAAGPAVRPCTSVDEILAAVKKYADEHPDEEWITGASYDGSLAPGGLFDARWLDSVVPDRPVVLRAWDYHTMWVNTEALNRAGIAPDTPDPVLGEIPHRPDGSVLGTLREWGATDLVTAVMPPRDEAQRIAALGTAADYYLPFGVTWVQDAWVEPQDVATYVEAARQGALRMRFNLALYADPRHFDTQLAQYAESRRAVDEVGSPFLTANTVKFFADGVVENETGALLAPYCSGLHSHGGQERSDSGENLGMRTWEGDSLAQAAQRVDELGFQIHIHAIGDAAVRQALDAIEYVQERNGSRDRRPVIAHVQLVDEADLERFATLGVIPNMQPLWAQMDALMTVLTIPRLGVERADRQYQMRTLHDTGAALAFGSDWPVSSGAPLDGIAIAVSRRTAEGEPEGGWTPHEIVPIDLALSSYTGAVAYQAFAEGNWGRIVPGASADLVWLGADPRSAPALQLPGVNIRATYLHGAQAYRADNGKV
ncbi:amidohydrolase [Mycolicibacterium anyangense]|uniref:Amidohydrolase n=1 Tax=Mycolicibacterium anyangense TaxID=1431246 RepID=A0A6N4WEQ9_9MYCO|nr:amidohydrolase [Mycolicibacterium anyangense]BBZ78432.1 amidohydrolase [Mycolicibacterium anyangense]